MELAHRKRLLATGGGAVSVIMMVMMLFDAGGHDEDVGADDDSFNDDYQYLYFCILTPLKHVPASLLKLRKLVQTL